MKFRTEIEIAKRATAIDYSSRMLTLGSCFALSIGSKLLEAKFGTCVNPSGVLFNPLSICATLDRFAKGRTVKSDELECAGGRWFHFDFHGAFSDATAQGAQDKINLAIEQGSAALAQCDTLLLTLGTAWIYEHRASGRVVANCHKLPSSDFVRRRMSVEQVVEVLALQIERHPSKRFILTLSPVRHLSDGLAGNSLSKATLRVAIEQLEQRYPNVDYFPAYEILIDDLRDYRFYADDMCHPSLMAIEYIWHKFCEVYISPSALATMDQVEAIVRAAAHRPFDSSSQAHREFCRCQLKKIADHPNLDFGKESAYFESQLQNNL